MGLTIKKQCLECREDKEYTEFKIQYVSRGKVVYNICNECLKKRAGDKAISSFSNKAILGSPNKEL